VALFGLLVFVAACAPIQALLNGPTESATSGNLVVYSALQPHLARSLLQQLEDDYPNINIELVIGPSTGIISRLLSEMDDPQADIVWGVSTVALINLEWRDALTAYEPQGASRIWSAFKDTSRPPYWVGHGASMSAYCVNEEALDALGLPVPTTWAALADPIYEGLIAMPDPSRSGGGYILIAAMFDLYGEIEAWQYLDALSMNVRELTVDVPRPCTLAASGDVPIGITFAHTALAQAKISEQLTTIYPEEGASWDMEGSALIRKNEIKPAAKTFLDWAISDDVLRVLGNSQGIASAPIEDFTPPDGFPTNPTELLIDKDFVWISANRARILAGWSQRVPPTTIRQP
jgi:iron(III) transport system substrate-binding protein